VSVKFLSAEWAEALKARLNDDAPFKVATATQTAKIQQVITSGDGEIHYWITIDSGTIDMGVGDVDAPDATITQSYDTAVGLAHGQVNAVTAYMTGKIKIAGNLGLLLGLQGALSLLPGAMAAIDTAY